LFIRESYDFRKKSNIYWLNFRKKSSKDPASIARINREIDALKGQLLETIVGRVFKEEKAKFEKILDEALDVVAGKIEESMKQAKALIAQGKTDIDCASSCLPDNLQKEAQEKTDDFKSKFDDLATAVNEKQKELAQSLAREYASNVKKLKDTFEEIRKESAMSWWEKAWIAIKKIAMIIYDVGKLLVKVLVKAVSVIGDILAHPIRFVTNLISAIGDGFHNFVSNIGTHLENIIFKLILGVVPPNIKMPGSWDAKGIFSFALDLIGLSKENIRAQAVEKLGEPVVSKLEDAFDLFVIFKKDGFAGLWEHIKDKIGDLKDQVIEQVKSYLTESIIKAAVKFLLSALTPVSGFIKACETIINVAKFFLENLKNILQLLDSILDSFIDIARGNLTNASKKVEGALADILLVGIKFLAALVGINLDKISAKIQKLFDAIRNPVNRAIKWLLDKAIAFAHKTGLVALVKKGKEKFEQGKEWAKEKGKAAVTAVKGWLGLQKTFTAEDGSSHKIFLSGSEDNPTLMVASNNPGPIKKFLDKFISQKKVDKEKKADASEAKRFIEENIDNLFVALKKERDEAKKLDLRQSLLEQFTILSDKIRLLLGKEPLNKIMEEHKYNLEGLTGTYGSMPKPSGDQFTADHQPQAAIIIYASKLNIFNGTRIKQIAGGSHADGAFAINLHKVRHEEGRTFGNDGKITKGEFVDKAVEIDDSNKSDKTKRKEIIKLIKVELGEDVKAMRDVAINKSNYTDLDNLGLEDEQKDDLRDTIKAQILSGEDIIASQNLDDLAS